MLIRRQDGRPWSVPHTGCCMDRGTESISIYVSNETLLNVIHLRRALSAGRDPRLRSPDVETYLCSSVGPQGKKQNLGRLTVASAVCCGCCSTDRERQRQRETLHNHIIYRYRCSCTSVVTKVELNRCRYTGVVIQMWMHRCSLLGVVILVQLYILSCRDIIERFMCTVVVNTAV